MTAVPTRTLAVRRGMSARVDSWISALRRGARRSRISSESRKAAEAHSVAGQAQLRTDQVFVDVAQRSGRAPFSAFRAEAVELIPQTERRQGRPVLSDCFLRAAEPIEEVCAPPTSIRRKDGQLAGLVPLRRFGVELGGVFPLTVNAAVPAQPACPRHGEIDRRPRLSGRCRHIGQLGLSLPESVLGHACIRCQGGYLQQGINRAQRAFGETITGVHRFHPELDRRMAELARGRARRDDISCIAIQRVGHFRSRAEGCGKLGGRVSAPPQSIE